MTMFTLFFAPSDQADLPMGDDFPSVAAARAAIPAAAAELAAQAGEASVAGRWYVYDNARRFEVWAAARPI